jgi:hemolysin III
MDHGERLNSLTHLVGLALALAGTAALVVRATHQGGPMRIVSFAIFGLSMILMYASSTLYHSLRGPSKAHWATFDHCAIYLLIAGTYTPFALVTLQGPRGWFLFALIWMLAAIGIARELWFGRGSAPALPLYLLMGWCGAVAAVPLLNGLLAHGWRWLLGGCLCYSVGVVFYRLGSRMPHSHAIWHVFVLVGTASHYVTVLRFVA